MAEERRPLAGKVALVTGGSRRIGRQICLRLARDGAAVAVNARSSKAEAESVAREIAAAGGRAITAMADIADPGQCAAMVERTVKELGRLDIVVHTAVSREHGGLDEIDLAAWHRALAVVLDGAFLTAKFAAPHLERTGGTIIMIGGATAFHGSKGPATPTAKAGLVGLTRCLAQALGPKGITANLVSPGRIEDETDTPDRREYLAKGRPDSQIPLGRHGTPEEIASIVGAMAGPDFRYVTGQVIHATGGYYMG